MDSISNNTAKQVSFDRSMDIVQRNKISDSGNISTAEPTKSLISTLEANMEATDTSLNNRQITQTETLSEELIVALRENDQKQVSSIIRSEEFNIYDQEAIIELMAILIETDNIKMLKFLHKNNILDIMQKQKSEQYPEFYCLFYAVAKVATEENLPKIKKMFNKLFKFGFIPLEGLDKRDFLERCKKYSNFNNNKSLRQDVVEVLEKMPPKTTNLSVLKACLHLPC
jgi:hypothetical protein